MQILHVAIASYVARSSREPYYSDESFVFVSLSLWSCSGRGSGLYARYAKHDDTCIHHEIERQGTMTNRTAGEGPRAKARRYPTSKLSDTGAPLDTGIFPAYSLN